MTAEADAVLKWRTKLRKRAVAAGRGGAALFVLRGTLDAHRIREHRKRNEGSRRGGNETTQSKVQYGGGRI